MLLKRLSARLLTNRMNASDLDVCIIAATRTPIGVFQGILSSFSSTDLGCEAIKGVLQQSEISPEVIDEAFIGNVLSANLGQAPARQACLKAGLPSSLPCTTVNKVCASGMKSVMLGAQSILARSSSVVLAGGMESMSNVPYYVPCLRSGQRMGHSSCIDGLLKDGLWDPYDDKHMGCCAESVAKELAISREEQDEFAIMSFEKASMASGEHSLWEITPLSIAKSKTNQQTTITSDEGISKLNREKMKKLKSAFTEDGTVTAGNSSQISDGAAMVLLAQRNKATALNLPVLARIVEMADAAQEPSSFPTTPFLAIKKLFSKLQRRDVVLSLQDIDIFEINEAFAVVALANAKLLGLDPEKVNVHGGAVAIGHPLGCSGCRILVTLINILRIKKKKFGIAAICNGGGGASAILIENEQC